MMETELIGAMAQFGVAGLIGWMWLSERRGAAARERQLEQAHERLMNERLHVEVLVNVAGGVQRALCDLESAQRDLCRTLRALARRRSRGAPGAQDATGEPGR
jgi:hypothetical protein